MRKPRAYFTSSDIAATVIANPHSAPRLGNDCLSKSTIRYCWEHLHGRQCDTLLAAEPIRSVEKSKFSSLLTYCGITHKKIVEFLDIVIM